MWWDHKFEDVEVHFIESPKRKCKVCGLEQTLTQNEAWGNKIGKPYWYPKSGRRCPKAVKPSE